MVRNGEMTLSDAKRVLRRFWWILPITTITLGAIGLGRFPGVTQEIHLPDHGARGSTNGWG